MASPAVGSARTVRLHSLTFVPEGNDVMIGCLATGSYAAFPPDGAALLRRIADGVPLEEAAGWYTREYGETVDLDDFLDTLTELGFLDTAAAGTAAVPRPVRWQRVGRAAFSPVAWVGYAVLVGAALVTMVRDPGLRPSYTHLFFSHYVTVIELVLFLGQLPGLLLHEGFHALAGRRLGLPSRLSVGRRLYYVVVQTEMNGLLGVPKARRYLPFLAGMLADVLWIGALTLAAGTIRATGGPALAAGICLGLAFTTLLRLVWQFYFYLETDLYYVVAAATGCSDLQGLTRARARDVLRRLVGRPPLARLEQWTDRDRAVSRWYLPFLLLGYTFSLGTLAVVGVPTAVGFLSTVAARFTAAGSPLSLLDAVVFTALNVAQAALVLAVVVRERRRSARTRTPATQPSGDPR